MDPRPASSQPPIGQPAEAGIDSERRNLILGGLAALPVLAAGCGGGVGSEGGGNPGPAAPHGTELRPLGAPQAAPGFPTLRKPTVGKVGCLPLSTPPIRDAPTTVAFWIVVDAGTDARAVAVMAGTGSAAPRLELGVSGSQGTTLRVQTDRAVRSVHVARAFQSGYAITSGAQLAGAAVARWDFDAHDGIRTLEFIAHPPVVSTEGIELDCLGTAT